MIIAVGDLHGDFQCVHDWLAMYDVRDTTLIQVGDVGLIPSHYVDGNGRAYQVDAWRPAFQRLGRELHDRNCRMYYLRGNHDDPINWGGTQNDRRLWATLIPLQDCINGIYCAKGARRNWNWGYCLGGAVSVDRTLRWERGYYYHPDEAARNPVLHKRMGLFSLVVTHAAPPWAPPFGDPRTNGGIAGYFQKDPALYGDVQAERERLARIWEHMWLSPHRKHNALWLYGHYHTTQRHSQDGVDYLCVGEKEFIDVTNYFK